MSFELSQSLRVKIGIGLGGLCVFFMVFSLVLGSFEDKENKTVKKATRDRGMQNFASQKPTPPPIPSGADDPDVYDYSDIDTPAYPSAPYNSEGSEGATQALPDDNGVSDWVTSKYPLDGVHQNAMRPMPQTPIPYGDSPVKLRIEPFTIQQGNAFSIVIENNSDRTWKFSPEHCPGFVVFPMSLEKEAVPIAVKDGTICDDLLRERIEPGTTHKIRWDLMVEDENAQPVYLDAGQYRLYVRMFDRGDRQFTIWEKFSVQSNNQAVLGKAFRNVYGTEKLTEEARDGRIDFVMEEDIFDVKEPIAFSLQNMSRYKFQPENACLPVRIKNEDLSREVGVAFADQSECTAEVKKDTDRLEKRFEEPAIIKFRAELDYRWTFDNLAACRLNAFAPEGFIAGGVDEWKDFESFEQKSRDAALRDCAPDTPLRPGKYALVMNLGTLEGDERQLVKYFQVVDKSKPQVQPEKQETMRPRPRPTPRNTQTQEESPAENKAPQNETPTISAPKDDIVPAIVEDKEEENEEEEDTGTTIRIPSQDADDNPGVRIKIPQQEEAEQEEEPSVRLRIP